MIETGTMPDTQEEYIAINLSDRKHKNRIINFCKESNLITNEFECSIHAQWTDNNKHPVIKMKKDDFLSFVQALNNWANNIKK